MQNLEKQIKDAEPERSDRRDRSAKTILPCSHLPRAASSRRGTRPGRPRRRRPSPRPRLRLQAVLDVSQPDRDRPLMAQVAPQPQHVDAIERFQTASTSSDRPARWVEPSSTISTSTVIPRAASTESSRGNNWASEAQSLKDRDQDDDLVGLAARVLHPSVESRTRPLDPGRPLPCSVNSRLQVCRTVHSVPFAETFHVNPPFLFP